MSTTTLCAAPRVIAVTLTMACLLALAATGCGESPPPPMTEGQFKEVKQEREKIIMKEYGAGAFKKGQKKSTAR